MIHRAIRRLSLPVFELEPNDAILGDSNWELPEALCAMQVDVEHVLAFLRDFKPASESSIDVLIADYTATPENFFSFNIKLAKRAAIKVATLRNIWLEIGKNNVEQQFDVDRIRSVG